METPPSIEAWLARVGLDRVDGILERLCEVAGDVSEVGLMNATDVARVLAPLSLKEFTLRKIQNEVAILREDRGASSRRSLPDAYPMGGAQSAAVELPAPKAVLAQSAAGPDALFLGIDLSTQSATGVLMDSSLQVVHRKSFNFDEHCPEFKTAAGMHVRYAAVPISCDWIFFTI